MAEAEEDFTSLPLPDRFQHKVWKVRKAAYEDAAKQFEVTPDEHDPAFRPFLQDSSLWKGAVADSNVAAQQDGIAAFCAYLKFGSRDGCIRARSHTVTPIAEKGLSSTRAATKASAIEAILLLIELDIPGPVIEELLPVLSNKQPKVIAATLAMLTAIFHHYGCKTVDPKPVLKVLPKAFSHADKNVRAEATNLAVEFYRWLREAMKPMFWSELKPTQQTDMEAAFEKIKAEPAPKQERFLRSQQAAMARVPPPGSGADVEEDDGGEDEVVEVDVFDLAEPQDVLSKVPANYTEALASSKWKERKEVLDATFAVLNVPRIIDGDFNEMIRGLAKSMKDANVAVVTVAAQCIEVLAKGLRKGFTKYRSQVTLPIMERLKEKKASIADALGAALDQVFLATSLTDCMEETMECLKHKNPQVKEGTMKFLIRCLRTTRTAPTKPEVAAIVEAGKKLLSESSEGLRSGGAEVLGTLMKIMGERAFNAHLEGLDDIRKTKIKEFFDAAEVKAKDKPKPVPVAKPPPSAAPAAAKKMVKKTATKKPPPPPSQYAQTAPAPAPLAPQPTARSVPSKLGGIKPPGGLKAPTQRTLAGPGGAAPPAIPSPRRPAVATPVEDEQPPPPVSKLSLGRGLTGRSLRPAAPPATIPSPEPASRISAVELAELEELRAEKERLARQNEELRAERSRLNGEIQELKNQNAELIEGHTKDMLNLKSKETQLVRARSDAESADAVSERLKRELERLKKALGSADRVASMQLHSPSRVDSAQGVYYDPAPGSPNGAHGHDGPRAERGYGGLGRNANAFRRASEEKENGADAISDVYRSKLSPELNSYAPMSRRSGSGSGSGGRASPARESFRSERREGSALSGATGDSSSQPVETWKRAAEVTSALKAKIEQMKARQGISKP